MTNFPENLAIEVIRAMRGNRAQALLSRQLGYKFNQVYLWETGRRTVGWENFANVCTFLDRPLEALLKKHFNLTSKTKISQILSDSIREKKRVEVARTLGISTSKLSRWLSGKSDPPADYVFRILNITYSGVFDFLNELAGKGKVSQIQKEVTRMARLREALYQFPYLGAVSAAMSLTHYKKLKTHKPGIIAAAIGISLTEEKRALEVLESIGQIRLVQGTYEVDPFRIDLTVDRPRFYANCKYWLKRIMTLQTANRKKSRSGYRVFPVSPEGREKILHAYFDFYRRLTALLKEDQAKHHDQVMVVSFEFFAPEET